MTQLLWVHVSVCVLEIQATNPDCWDWSQHRWIQYILAFKAKEQVTADDNKALVICTCTHLRLDLYHYYPLVLKLVAAIEEGKTVASYGDIMMVCGCSHNSAKKMWNCIDIIQKHADLRVPALQIF